MVIIEANNALFSYLIVSRMVLLFSPTCMSGEFLFLITEKGCDD